MLYEPLAVIYRPRTALPAELTGLAQVCALDTGRSVLFLILFF